MKGLVLRVRLTNSDRNKWQGTAANDHFELEVRIDVLCHEPDLIVSCFGLALHIESSSGHR